jgi:hypothetical protein
MTDQTPRLYKPHIWNDGGLDIWYDEESLKLTQSAIEREEWFIRQIKEIIQGKIVSVVVEDDFNDLIEQMRKSR